VIRDRAAADRYNGIKCNEDDKPTEAGPARSTLKGDALVTDARRTRSSTSPAIDPRREDGRAASERSDQRVGFQPGALIGALKHQPTTSMEITMNRTLVCSDCFYAIRPSEYFPESSTFAECATCDNVSLVARITRAEAIEFLDGRPAPVREPIAAR
jgi:hypothetical protein